MPVWLDAIPEKAPKAARPGTAVGCSSSRLSCWGHSAHAMVLDVRANRLCLLVHRAGPPVLHGGLFSAYAGLPTKPNR